MQCQIKMHDCPTKNGYQINVACFCSCCLLLMRTRLVDPRMTSMYLDPNFRILIQQIAPRSFLFIHLPSFSFFTFPHMTRRLPSRPDRQPSTRHLPDITYRHVLAPSPLAPTAARSMERTIYPSTRRPSFGSRRSSSHIGSHISRHDPSDFNDGHRTLAVRPRYPSRAKSSIGYDSGFRNDVIYCPPPRPVLRQGPMSGSYIGDPFATLDELPRRAEVYEVPISYTSDLDGMRGRSSAQNSRPSSRGSEYVYTEYEDDEERERKRLLGTDLYGYVMALRLKERLVDVRQVLSLYKDFDRASGRKCCYPSCLLEKRCHQALLWRQSFHHEFI